MDVEFLVVELNVFLVELVIDAVGPVVHIAELHVTEDRPMVAEGVSRLDESVAVEFVSVGIVVLVVAIGEVEVGNTFVGDIGYVTEVVTFEILC